MVIAGSNVSMAGSTTRTVKYTQTKQTLMRNALTGEMRYSENTFENSFSDCRAEAHEDMYNNYKQEKKGDGKANSIAQPTLSVQQRDSMQSLVAQLRNFLVNFRHRLSLMIGRSFLGDTGSGMTLSDAEGVLDVSNGGDVSIWTVTNYTEYTSYESETLNFSTTGKVVTGDGKTLEFDMELAMSREYVETSEALEQGVKVIMTDPLVIQLGSNPVGVSDQKWKFDIDGDGSMDEISMLSKGSGFLAFDKNGDGSINDGTELFGAKSGNGFRDLMEYDLDKNGWIDENDSIYSKLSVWVKDEAGEDSLLSLKEANVGAIYLGNVRTDYALKSDEDNSHNAQIRRSGAYLTEAGVARSIMQLDMVKM